MILSLLGLGGGERWLLQEVGGGGGCGGRGTPGSEVRLQMRQGNKAVS